MNCGLGNLYSLKTHLLARTLAADTRFDEVITDLGRGVAGLMEKHCNRQFARSVGVTEIFPADRCAFPVSRFPLESVSKSEVKVNETDGWVEQASDFVLMIDAVSGIILTNQHSDVGQAHEQVRFTFSGGYHIDFQEPSEGETAVPTGAALLPHDLRLAWLMQCRVIWTAFDKLGAGLVKEGPSGQFVTGALSSLTLSPQLVEMLAPYRRFAMV